MDLIRFDHIALALPRIADAAGVLVGVLGGQPDAGGPGDGFAWGAWRFAGGGRLEVIEPSGADGFLHRFLARHGPGIHHVTFKVASLARACARAEAHGYAVVGRDESDPAWRVAYLHPKQAQGIVVQLGQPGPPGPRRRWTPPPAPADPPPAVTVVGLRLAARSAEGARRQWAEVLGGAAAAGAGDGALAFRWPASPMRIVVEVDPGRPQGPLAIEVASARHLDLPAGPCPGLGATTFRVVGQPASGGGGAGPARPAPSARA